MFRTETTDSGLLFKTEWYRIILDEAHTIRNHNTAQAKACLALDGELRWCLTGRLVYNSLGDIFTPLRFIGVVDWVTYQREILSIDRKDPVLAAQRAQVSESV